MEITKEQEYSKIAKDLKQGKYRTISKEKISELDLLNISKILKK